jgi:arsenate reductase (thioredoxin)
MSLEDFPEFDKAVQAHLDGAVKKLASEFDGIFEPKHVRAIVDASARSLRDGNVAAYIPILAERFARERLRAQAETEGRLARGVAEVLFVSLSGGGRAQMAAALLAQRAGDTMNIATAGSAAAGGHDANVVAAMEEVGIDMAESFTRPVTPEILARADVVVTMGQSVGEVEIPEGTRHVDWRVGNPAGAEIDEVRRVREDIQRRVDALARELLDREPESSHAPA